MATHRRTWQKFEQRVAALFGCKRQYGSGSGGREDQTRSDSTHPRLFIEAKFRETHAARTIHDATKALARKEGKTPVVVLADKNRPGFLVCVHSDDLDALVVEWASLHDARLWPLIVAAIKSREGLDPGDFALPPKELSA